MDTDVPVWGPCELESPSVPSAALQLVSWTPPWCLLYCTSPCAPALPEDDKTCMHCFLIRRSLGNHVFGHHWEHVPQKWLFLRQTVYPLRLKLMTWCWSLWLVEGWASLTLATLLSVYQTFFFIYVVLLRLTWDLYRSVHPGRHHNRIMNGTKLSMYLQLKVLAAVVPLKQDAPLASAFTELLDSTLVFLHLFNHLRSQLHHWLVMSDGQQENMVGGETSLSQSHVTLEID